MPSRAKFASLLTVVALGVLAAVALASGSGGDPAAVQTQDDVAKPKLRTEVVRETVHRRAKSSAFSGDGGGAADAAAPARSASPSPSPSAGGGGDDGGGASVVQAVATPDDHGGRHGRGDDDDDHFDDHGGDRDDDDHFDDDGFDDHSGSGGGGDDDSGHGRGRGRGRGGDDD